jgi:hypothetical protein
MADDTDEPSKLPEPSGEPVEEVTGEVAPDTPRGSSTRPRFVVTTYQHSGPLPDQAWFRELERLHHGSTELILEDYRDQRAHEREMEKESLALDRESFKAFSRYQTLQLALAGSVALLLAIGGIVLVATGHSLVGLTILVGEIAALVLAFFGRSRAQKPVPDEQADDEEPA